MISATFSLRNARTAASIVDPVAIPSSIRITDAPLRLGDWNVATVCAFAASQFDLLTCDGGVYLFFRYPDGFNDFLVEHRHATTRDCSKREFFVIRHPQFAYDKHIQGRMNCSCDFKGDRHAPTRQREHEYVRSIPEVFQLTGEKLTCISSVFESVAA